MSIGQGKTRDCSSYLRSILLNHETKIKEEKLSQGYPKKKKKDWRSGLLIPDSITKKEPLPFVNGAPNTEKSSSPWSPVTISGFRSDEKLGRY